jgi:50S ribosomal protein L16 3-hydroxylase
MSLAVLEAMPSPAVFYETYWGRRPFVVRGGIPVSVFKTLITDDELAGLSMEDGPVSRLVNTGGAVDAWTCRFGPFSEADLRCVGDVDWSLLVQNVEQYHPQTAALLPWFNFAPRWMMDDIMVSLSAPGGSVGPHMDSYHVFLVQGQGQRHWKISRQALQDEAYVENAQLKVLASAFDGDAIEVNCGDVLYVPPRFAHEGTTRALALTYSVGFLGPKMSDLYTAYGHYLAAHEGLDSRYAGHGLTSASSGFCIDKEAISAMAAQFSAAIQGDGFSQWLVAFFTESGHEDLGLFEPRETPLTAARFKAEIKGGARLVKPLYVKFAVTANAKQGYSLGVDGTRFAIAKADLPVIQCLAGELPVCLQSDPGLLVRPARIDLLLTLYNHQALEFAGTQDRA